MNTVQKNNIITKRKVQELLENKQKELNISNKNLKKLIKSMRSNQISRKMRDIFYGECIKRIENKVTIKEEKYPRLTFADRITIEVLYGSGFNLSFIGAFVGKHRSSIKREINKNSIEYWDMLSTKSPYIDRGQADQKYYSSEKAQKRAEESKLKNRKKCKIDRYSGLRANVVKLLKEKKIEYSPDVIAGLSKAGKLKDAEVSIGAKAIYKAVHERKYGLSINNLPHKMRYHKGKKDIYTESKEVSENKKEISIEVMPEEIKKKQVDTHFEGDSIIGKAKGRNNTLITLVNIASQFVFVKRSRNKTTKATKETIDNLEKEIPELNKIMESLLLDNGIEFSKFEELMESVETEKGKRFQIYFAHPYASYERGSNENKNRLIRRYFRKGKLVETLTDEDILNIARKINNMPRKVLGYRTPLEVFEYNLKKKGIDTSFLEIYRIELPRCLIA